MYIKDWFKLIFPLFLTWLLGEVPNIMVDFVPRPSIVISKLCLWVDLQTDFLLEGFSGV